MTDATWLSNPLSGDYNDGNNWVGGNVPSLDGTAFFGTSTNVALSFSAAITQAGGWTFDPGLVTYDFTIASGHSVSFTEAGITVTSGHVHFAVDGALSFQGMSTAGLAAITVNGASQLDFNDASTAGDAVIDNNHRLFFFDNSHAGNAQISNEVGGYVYFWGQASAENASITNGADLEFYNSSTAASATIVNNFWLGFGDGSTAGGATITTGANAVTHFSGTSSGGNAQFLTAATGMVDFSASKGSGNDGKMTVGSIAGSGTYELGGNELTVGSNGLSTEVGGAINDNGWGGGTGASLVKVGAGTLTLSGTTSTYSGGTTLEAGTVSVSADANLGNIAGGLTFDGGTLRVTGTSYSGTSRTLTWGQGGGGFDIANAANNFIVVGELTSAGGLTKLGAGGLVLGGVNGYTGLTTIEAGTLALSGSGTIAVSSGVVDDGVFDISVATGGASIKTLSGNGAVELGDRELTLTGAAGNFGGAINGFGSLTLAGGSETLSHAGTYSGGTKLLSGTLDLAAVNAAGIGAVGFTSGAQTLKIENAALAAHHFGNTITGFGTGDVIDLTGLTFKPGAFANYNAATHMLSVTSGAVTDTLALASPAGAHYAVFNDQAGGTMIGLGISGTAGSDTIDATHHPAGKTSPGAGHDGLFGLAGNDTLKALGGGDVLVGGAGRDTLYGGAGGDSFVFASADSATANRDVIMDFSHAAGDRIDLLGIDADITKAGNQAFVFIGGDTFAHYHATHPGVVGMVRYAGGVVEGNVNGNFAADFAITVHGATALHAGDFVL